MSEQTADVLIKPQPGPQLQAASSDADVLIYGGAAGGGKTYFSLLHATQFVHLPEFRGVIFRRESTQIDTGGGLWDQSHEIFPYLGGEAVKSPHYQWTFPSGAKIQFRHLQYEDTKYNYQGAQLGLVEFDELTHFTEGQWRYLISRNRTSAPMVPNVRATTNPDGDSWVYDWVKPFMQDDGVTPDPDKCGELRYFTIEDDRVKWVDEDWRGPGGVGPQSFTFIASRLEDNPAMLENNPDYAAKLEAQSTHDKKRLKLGKWVAESTKRLFRNHKIQVCERGQAPLTQVPELGARWWLRYWDLADTAVEPSEQAPRSASGPDWTAGACGTLWRPQSGPWSSKGPEGRKDPILIVSDVAFDQREGADKDDWMYRIASNDGRGTVQAFEQEGGSSGKYVVEDYTDELFSDWPTMADKPTGDKETRAKPLRRLADLGRVWFVRGPWVRQTLWWLERFPDHKKDVVDALAGLLKCLKSQEFAERTYDPGVPTQASARGTGSNPWRS